MCMLKTGWLFEDIEALSLCCRNFVKVFHGAEVNNFLIPSFHPSATIFSVSDGVDYLSMFFLGLNPA